MGFYQDLMNSEGDSETPETAPGYYETLTRGDKKPEPSNGAKVLKRLKDGGRIVQLPDGRKGYVSAAYSTTDPDQVAKLEAGESEAGVARYRMQETNLEKAPGFARVQKIAEGMPFVGSNYDEAIGAVKGDEYKDSMRAMSEAKQEVNPIESAALKVAGGIASVAPLAGIAGAPAIAETIGGSMLKKSIGTAAIGAIEGGIYGAGEGKSTGERLDNAALGAGIGGAVGAVAGPIVDLGVKGAKNAVNWARGNDVKTIMTQLGISAPAARVVKKAFSGGDQKSATAALKAAGKNGMLADADIAARALLDAAAASGGVAERIVRGAVDQRVTDSGKVLNTVMNKYLGKPLGLNKQTRQLMKSTSSMRQGLYDRAFSKPINYANEQGVELRKLLSRVPAGAVNRSKELMHIKEEASKQINATIQDNGKVVYETLPDVRQIDYIIKGLETAPVDQFGNKTMVGRAQRDHASKLRKLLKSMVPEYGEAVAKGSSTIRRREAIDAGSKMLRPSTTREMVEESLTGLSPLEKTHYKQGLRQHIDDTLANVKRTLSDPDIPAREGYKILSDLSSRASREKIVRLMGKKEGAALLKHIDEAAIAYQLKAAVSRNSATASRQAIHKAVTSEVSLGPLQQLATGSPVEAAKKLTSVLTGQDEAALAAKESGLFEEIAKALITKRGKGAEKALKLVYGAMEGQILNDAQARMVANQVTLLGLGVSVPLISREAGGELRN